MQLELGIARIIRGEDSIKQVVSRRSKRTAIAMVLVGLGMCSGVGVVTVLPDAIIGGVLLCVFGVLILSGRFLRSGQPDQDEGTEVPVDDDAPQGNNSKGMKRDRRYVRSSAKKVL